MRPEGDVTSAQAWLEFAEEDLQAAETLRLGPGAPQIICFLAQQAAEKAYKAYLAWYGEEDPPRTHDIARLRAEILAAGAENAPADADDLTPYATTGRYPSRHPVSPEEIEPALAMAREVVTWVKKAIGLE